MFYKKVLKKRFEKKKFVPKTGTNIENVEPLLSV